MVAFFGQGRYGEMERAAQGLMQRFPQNGALWKALATAIVMQGRIKDALPAMEKAAAHLPNDAEAHSNLGNVYQDHARFQESEACYRRAIGIRPGYFEAHSSLGASLREQGRLDEAEASCRRALEIRPDSADALGNLGNVFLSRGKWREAEACFRQCIRIAPRFSNAFGRLSFALNRQGRLAEGVSCLRQAIEANPNDASVYSAFLFNLGYGTNYSSEQRLEAVRRYGQMVAAKATGRYASWRCLAAPSRLRIGLVSGDFGDHPVGYFLEGILPHFDRLRVDFIAYSTLNRKDSLTERIQPFFSEWKSLIGYDDAAAARLIHDDGIHILVDLSGHTAYNRLPIFAYKSAPVQISWLGYIASTGVEQIDYLLADRIGVPENQRDQFVEKIWYLPDTRVCFTPPENAPDTSPSPALTNGYVTFGCFQNLVKIGDEVLAAWAQILAASPASRLRVQCHELGYAHARELITHRMLEKGIDCSRVSLHAAVDRQRYLGTLAEVDMILDTFPYPGITTTCEALWMGVPVLNIAGESLLERGGASVMTAIGLPDWVADNQEDYVCKALAFAGDVTGLSDLRQGLRARTAASPVMDAPRFARNLEEAFWEMWKQK